MPLDTFKLATNSLLCILSLLVLARAWTRSQVSLLVLARAWNRSQVSLLVLARAWNRSQVTHLDSYIMC